MELLIPDFNGEPELLAEVFDSRPEVLAHNVETVPRIFKRIRPAFRYERSLDVITQARDAGLVTKSNLILGMGEERAEVSQALRDLHDAGCELITITQYLRPTPRHHPVERWVKPEEFVELRDEAERDRFLRGDERAAGALVVPGGPALPPGAGGPRERGGDRLIGRPQHGLPLANGNETSHTPSTRSSVISFSLRSPGFEPTPGCVSPRFTMNDEVPSKHPWTSASSPLMVTVNGSNEYVPRRTRPSCFLSKATASL